MIGALIGGGLSAAGSIAGAILGAKSAKKQEEMIEQAKSENEAWYNRRYNEDATQRADAQAMINRVNEEIKARNKQAAGTAAVMGAGSEAEAQAKAANNSILADTAAQITAQGEARKDAIEQTYMTEKQRLNQQQQQAQAAKTAAIGQAATGILGAGASIAGNMDDDVFFKKKTE